MLSWQETDLRFKIQKETKPNWAWLLTQRQRKQKALPLDALGARSPKLSPFEATAPNQYTAMERAG